MGGRMRWAIFTAFLSTGLAVALGVAAWTYSDEEKVSATAPGPVEGNYAVASTTIVLNTPFARPPEIVVTGGRLAIGADGHVFWSLQMHSKDDPSRSGRLSCEGSFDSARRQVSPSPRYGYSSFVTDNANRDIERAIYESYCAGLGLDRPDNGPWDVSQSGSMLELKGRGGAIVWRRE
jgi:hypothetical protein